MNITFDNVSFKYIEKPILDKASFSITDSDKIGVVGVNGTGKTTLLKLILGVEKPNSGDIIISGGMRINYLEQDPKFDETKSLIDIVMEKSTKEFPILEYEANSILTKLGFLDTSITTKGFSGGQRKRLALAKTLVTPADMIILDEPTNHLDRLSREALEDALMEYEGTMLIVSHDRYFINKLADKIYKLDKNGTKEFKGNYDFYLAHDIPNEVQKEVKEKNTSYKERKEKEALERKKANRIKKIEEEIAKNDEEIAKLEEQSLSPEIGANYEKAMEITAQIADLKAKNEELFEEWSKIN